MDMWQIVIGGAQNGILNSRVMNLSLDDQIKI